MTNLAQLSAYIRFQLSQLKVQNKHHEFEHLARHFARLLICQNILPATGPVSAGGDQGRDFETYRSYLTKTSLGKSTFLGSAPGKKIVFACSLRSDIEAKIRSDVDTICVGGVAIDDIYYFAESDIPISKRHALQKWATDKHNVSLEILDGQAIAEALTSVDVFWIAEEYLSVSAEHYPQSKDDDAQYMRFRSHWFSEDANPISYADFFEIKYGLRKARLSRSHKVDLGIWMRVMERFLNVDTPPPLRRRAIYEVCVAALRGQNKLDEKAELVTEYFSKVKEFEVDELRDTITLLSYCSSAQINGQFNIDTVFLYKWTKELVGILSTTLGKESRTGTRCLLLEMLGCTELLQFRKAPVAERKIGDPFHYWLQLIKEVRLAKLFPLEDFADLLTIITPVAGEDAHFQKLTQKVDELLSTRTSGFVAAQKCRDRAMKFLENGRYIPAIKQLHTTRVKWFAAETLKGSALAMMILSKCYQELGLSYAGVYYALGAAVVAFQSNDDDVKELLPRAIFLAADSYYTGGATFTHLQLIRAAFYAHANFEKESGDIEKHENFQLALVHGAVTRGLVERLQPELIQVVDQQIELWPIGPEFKQDMRTLCNQPENWIKTDPEEILWGKIEEQLAGRPFSDLGNLRRIQWKALGLTWIVKHGNTFDETRMGEEFAATCQIIAADLADIDVCVLPTTVCVLVSLYEGTSYLISELPDNKAVSMEVQFPRNWVGSHEHFIELRKHILGVAGAVLHQCTFLDDRKYMQIIEKALKGGLPAKTFSVRPYAELYAEFITKDIYNELDRTKFEPTQESKTFEPRIQPELAAPNTNAPGYTKKKSKEFIANRYKGAIKPIKITLPLLLKDEGFRMQIRKLRAKAYKDWHILLIIANIAVQYRVFHKVGR